MAIEAPPAEGSLPSETTVLFPEARRLERRRRLWWGALVLALATAGACAGIGATSPSSSPPSVHVVTTSQLLARPLHVPSLGPGGRCPVSVGKLGGTRYFGGYIFGRGPVRVAVGNGADAARGRIDLGTSTAPGWYSVETIWYALPSYDGTFVVRAAKVGTRGPVEVAPGPDGHEPGSGPLVAVAGPTTRTFTYGGYRVQPGSTWVAGPGCYAWQVDGSSFSDVIVVDLVLASDATAS